MDGITLVPRLQSLLADTTKYTAKNANLHNSFTVTFGPTPQFDKYSMTRMDVGSGPFLNDYAKSRQLTYMGVFPDNAHFKLLVYARESDDACKYILNLYVGDETVQEFIGPYYIY